MTRIEGSYQAAAGRQALWEVLSDPERLGAALPGVALVEADGGDGFSARVRPATNVGVTPLDLEVRVLERDEGRAVRLTGDGAGGEHRVAFDVTLRLSEQDGGTQVDWDAAVQAFGGLASLSQRVLPALLRDQVAIALGEAERQALAA